MAGKKKAGTSERPEKAATVPEIDFSNPEYYVCRELSWLQFNLRVLSEARDKGNPLFERLKFLSIVSSNLDEFFMVRVASLKDQVLADYTKRDIAGLTAEQQLREISVQTHVMVDLQYTTFRRSVLPALEREGLHMIGQHEELTEREAAFVDRYFQEVIYPVLTPMAVDSSRPFPLIRNKTLNIAALIQKKKGVKPLIRVEEKKRKKQDGEEGRPDFAIVQVPSVLPRIIALPPEAAEPRKGIRKTLILMEEIIERNISSLFLNYDILAAHPFRIMRNAEFEIDEEDAADLLVEIQKKLKRRQWGEAIRIEAEDSMDRRLLKILCDELAVDKSDLFEINGPLDLTVLMKLYGTEGFERLKYPAHVPQPVPALMNDDDIFTNIRRGDILLSHPYQSFDPVVSFIQTAAKDPDVLAIKQTLYRVSGNSPIIRALAEAADNGKQVTVLVELKARFDEENNIAWAKTLEKAGCHVLYGLLGLKTHSKITLVVRAEEDGIRRYVHLGTGNYNDSTAKLYTDIGLLSCRREFGEDATAVFNMLSGYSEPLFWNRLVVAPLWMRDRFREEIERVGKAAREGKPAFIRAKMNSLSDQEMIEALYRASADGVRIDLIVRGICCLRVGIPGVSENIHVRSIVGNFLEHARIFQFHADGEDSVLLGSADWMTRNLDNRVEIVFPVMDAEIRDEILHYLDTEIADNVKASVYLSDGSYEKEDLRGKKKVNSQEQFVLEARSAARGAAEAGKRHIGDRTFVTMKQKE
ncbi:MAG: RNA degradosome polyphosphate kinase [Stomatobaculum sp.]